jgi:hypothetical protein
MIARLGGKFVNLATQGEERAGLPGRPDQVTRAQHDPRSLCEFERLAMGVVSPLIRSRVRAMMREYNPGARSDELKRFAAGDDFHEPPNAAACHLTARNTSPEESAKHIVNYPADHGLIQRTGFSASMTFDAPAPEKVSANRLAFET